MSAAPLSAFAVTLVLAVADWVMVATERRKAEYFSKPAIITALIVAALLVVRSDPHDGALAPWIVVGLVFSLAGDIFLMLPQDLFVPGLASFLLAHVCYVVGFNTASLTSWVAGVVAVVLVGAVIGTIGRGLAPGLRDRPERIPVSVYMAVIGVMLASALTTPWRAGWPGGAAAAATVGAALFTASDSMIGWSRFRSHFARERVWIMVTYHLGQIGIVLSLLR